MPEIKNKNYFISVLDVPPSSCVSTIDVKHSYNGKQLEEAATYLYEYKVESTGKVLDGKNIKVVNISSNQHSVSERDRFLYVQVYKLPWPQSSGLFQVLVPKKYWFTGDMEQNIDVDYLRDGQNKHINYNFNLHWFMYDSIIDAISSLD